MDYILAFIQALINSYCHIKFPNFIEIHSNREWVIKANKNIYGKCQAGIVWNKYLVEKLASSELGFRQSKVDECVFYWGEIIYILYTDDYILVGPYE